MTEPFLILHKVRGEPAFDIAAQIVCGICHNDSHERTLCEECDGVGFWWIIPTSGHRAHPYQNWRLEDVFDVHHEGDLAWNYAMPEGWPDHYPCNPSPASPSFSLSSIINKLAPKLRR